MLSAAIRLYVDPKMRFTAVAAGLRGIAIRRLRPLPRHCNRRELATSNPPAQGRKHIHQRGVGCIE